MKAVSKIALLISVGMLAPVAASARSTEQSYLETCRKEPGVPVPIEVVAPDIGAEYSGSEVEIEFVVDQAGKPAELTVKSAEDSAVAEAVMDAVKRWKFKPAERNGVPVATKVVLPVTIVEPKFEVFASR